MAYNKLESSNQDGRPIYLYEFRLNDNYWRYTSADQNVSLNGHIWEAISISDDGVRQTGETQVDALSINLPTTSDIATLYIGTPPINPVYLTIRRYHFGDTEAAVVYVGEVSSVNSSTPAQSTITCVTLSASMERNGLRLSWGRGCPHALYDSQCRVNKYDHQVNVEIESVGGGDIVSKDFKRYGDKWFSGGYIEWNDPVRGVERRAIEAHVGDKITIFGTVSGLYGGMILKAFPGCSRVTKDCTTKFNNLANFGGFPSLPGRSPFDGNPIY